MGEILKALDIGLSRLLRYSYGGFLLVAFGSFLGPESVRVAREAMSWELTAVVALVMGAGIYALHRSAVVPLHHGFLCLVWALVDRVRGVSKEESTSPTRWLASLGVPLAWRIAAYTTVRRSSIFEKDKAAWDVTHAEAGLVLMTAEAFGVAAVYLYTVPQSPLGWHTLAWCALGLLVLSYAVFPQHALECLQFRGKEPEIRQILEAVGLLGRKSA